MTVFVTFGYNSAYKIVPRTDNLQHESQNGTGLNNWDHSVSKHLDHVAWELCVPNLHPVFIRAHFPLVRPTSTAIYILSTWILRFGVCNRQSIYKAISHWFWILLPLSCEKFSFFRHFTLWIKMAHQNVDQECSKKYIVFHCVLLLPAIFLRRVFSPRWRHSCNAFWRWFCAMKSGHFIQWPFPYISLSNVWIHFEAGTVDGFHLFSFHSFST